MNLLLDVLNARLCEKELECAKSRFENNIFPAYELQAKGSAKDADQLRQMISTLTEMRKKPDNEPFKIAVPEITPTNL